MAELDDTDLKILEILKDNARTSVSEIARQVHKSRTAVEARITRMETCGPIKGYKTLIENDSKPSTSLSYLLFRNNGLNVCFDIWSRIKQRPGIIEAVSLFGDVDMIVVFEHESINQVIDFKEDILQTGLVKSVDIMPALTHWMRK